MSSFRIARVVLACALASTLWASVPEFDRKEPITLDLKDASIVEVITLLGSLASVPVSISPDVHGTVTIRVQDMPYDRVLERLGKENGISLRIVGGRLVATLESEAPAPAPSRRRALSGPRMPVEEYARGAEAGGPIFVSVRASGAESCGQLTFERGWSWEIPVPGSDSSLAITQFEWEPVTRTRLLAIELPGTTSRVAALDASASATGTIRRGEDSIAWTVAAHGESGSCNAAIPRRTPSAAAAQMFYLEVWAKRSDGTTELLSGAGMQVIPGTGFGTSGGLDDNSRNRELAIHGFLSADGQHVAAALAAKAVWTDPSDGREYVYAQVSPSAEIRFVALAPKPAALATLGAGSVLDASVELTIRTEPASAK